LLRFQAFFSPDLAGAKGAEKYAQTSKAIGVLAGAQRRRPHPDEGLHDMVS